MDRIENQLFETEQKIELTLEQKKSIKELIGQKASLVKELLVIRQKVSNESQANRILQIIKEISEIDDSIQEIKNANLYFEIAKKSSIEQIVQLVYGFKGDRLALAKSQLPKFKSLLEELPSEEDLPWTLANLEIDKYSKTEKEVFLKKYPNLFEFHNLYHLFRANFKDLDIESKLQQNLHISDLPIFTAKEFQAIYTLFEAGSFDRFAYIGNNFDNWDSITKEYHWLKDRYIELGFSISEPSLKDNYSKKDLSDYEKTSKEHIFLFLENLIIQTKEETTISIGEVNGNLDIRILENQKNQESLERKLLELWDEEVLVKLELKELPAIYVKPGQTKFARIIFNIFENLTKHTELSSLPDKSITNGFLGNTKLWEILEPESKLVAKQGIGYAIKSNFFESIIHWYQINDLNLLLPKIIENLEQKKLEMEKSMTNEIARMKLNNSFNKNKIPSKIQEIEAKHQILIQGFEQKIELVRSFYDHVLNIQLDKENISNSESMKYEKIQRILNLEQNPILPKMSVLQAQKFKKSLLNTITEVNLQEEIWGKSNDNQTVDIHYQETEFAGTLGQFLTKLLEIRNSKNI